MRRRLVENFKILQTILGVFDKHMTAEMTGDLETTLATMTDNSHLNHGLPVCGAECACKVC